MECSHSLASFWVSLWTMTPLSDRQERRGKCWRTSPVVIRGSCRGCSSVPPSPAPSSPGSQGVRCTQYPRPSLPPMGTTGRLCSSSANGHFAWFPQLQGPRGMSESPQGWSRRLPNSPESSELPGRATGRGEGRGGASPGGCGPRVLPEPCKLGAPGGPQGGASRGAGRPHGGERPAVNDSRRGSASPSRGQGGAPASCGGRAPFSLQGRPGLFSALFHAPGFPSLEPRSLPLGGSAGSVGGPLGYWGAPWAGKEGSLWIPSAELTRQEETWLRGNHCISTLEQS